MAPRTLPGLGLSGYAPFGETGWNTWADVNWRTLSALGRLTVLDVVNALPGSPSDGDIYIMSESAGVSPNTVAVRDNGAWVHIPAVQGWTAYNRATARYLRFSGTLWREVLEDYSATQGTILFRGAAGWQALAPGTDGQFLKTNGAAANPAWATPPASGVAFTPAGTIAATDVQAAIAELDTDTQVLFSAVATALAGKVNDTGDTMTGALQVPAGTAGAPGLQVGDADTGLFQASGQLSLAVDGVEEARLTSTGLLVGTGTPTEALHVLGAGTDATRAKVESGGTAQMVVSRFSTNATAPVFAGMKARGSIGAPTVVSSGDVMFSLQGQGYNGSAYTIGGEVRFDVVAATPSSSDMESRYVALLVPAAGVSRTEVFRVEHATGFSMFGANPVIDQNRLFALRSSTIAGLIAAATAGTAKAAWATDLGGTGGGVVVCDGTNWRRGKENGVEKRATDVAFTLTPLTSGPQQFHEGTLTADRAVTLSTTGAYDGCEFTITRTGGGAFNLTVAYGSGGGSTKTIATNGWARFVYSGVDAFWRLAAAGTL